jgi:aryl-alcohol dehydrogenase-like predicted oxidoreductase
VLRRAIELGVDFIDTADSYGPNVSEELISETLYPYPDDLVIATKGGLVRTCPGRWPANGRPQHLIEACEGSLRRLRLDQIPLYQFHRPDPAVPLEDSIGALVSLKEQGKIRHIGLSNVTEEQLRRAQRLSPSCRSRTATASTTAGRSRWSTCAGRNKWSSCCGRRSRISTTPPVVRELAHSHDAMPRQIGLAWLLARSPSIRPIPGTGSVSHLEDDIAATAIKLTPAEVVALTHNAG